LKTKIFYDIAGIKQIKKFNKKKIVTVKTFLIDSKKSRFKI